MFAGLQLLPRAPWVWVRYRRFTRAVVLIPGLTDCSITVDVCAAGYTQLTFVSRCASFTSIVCDDHEDPFSILLMH